MKFIVFVEGHTENKALSQFLKKWLDPKLPKPVGIKTVRFEGWPELIKDAPLKAKMHLEGPEKNDVIAVISLLDLYGPSFYPTHLQESKERYQWAKNEIEGKVNEARFFQFFAVHEVEAWLLSDPNIFPANVKKAFPKKISHPEAVNFNEPPGKLLERLYPLHVGRSYKKVVNGQDLFGRLDPEIAYNKCPSLKMLLDKMLDLAQNFNH
ncbi:uncharacterized protein DUF4276 [Desulfobotulus alkaliphilus]|uniref:Uncharacterized protein DUF4276 n=1 Tax=Desulfobotulus alkaliphilus TaxID=622671 RepID=A0A562S4H9_9BACT|nr:DUF4276 family protein [Desulfobotulus alkaliphilus]TWI75566.1 uncharacterized protein DUF4276 [Desulfobotulus alkaliphilus]